MANHPPNGSSKCGGGDGAAAAVMVVVAAVVRQRLASAMLLTTLTHHLTTLTLNHPSAMRSTCDTREEAFTRIYQSHHLPAFTSHTGSRAPDTGWVECRCQYSRLLTQLIRQPFNGLTSPTVMSPRITGNSIMTGAKCDKSLLRRGGFEYRLAR